MADAANSGEAIEPHDLPYLPQGPRCRDTPIGLIGCGGVSGAHLRAYRHAGYSVVALCDPNKEAAEARRAEFYPEARIFTSHHELLTLSDVAVVDVATHTDVRHVIVADALRAGKHVLSQKPFAEDLDAAERLCDLAESCDRTLAVNQNGRWAPHFSYLLSAARAGQLGRVVAADFFAYWPHDQMVQGTRFADMPDLILLDFGIHWFDLVGQLFADAGPARSVHATLASRPGQLIGVPTMAQVTIDYDDAQASLLFRGSVHAENRRGYHVAGTNGVLHQIGRSGGPVEVEIARAGETVLIPLNGTWFENGFHGTMAELLLALEEGRRPANDARSVLAGLELCFAAVASSRSGTPVVPGSARSLTVTDAPLDAPLAG